MAAPRPSPPLVSLSSRPRDPRALALRAPRSRAPRWSRFPDTPTSRAPGSSGGLGTCQLRGEAGRAQSRPPARGGFRTPGRPLTAVPGLPLSAPPPPGSSYKLDSRRRERRAAGVPRGGGAVRSAGRTGWGVPAAGEKRRASPRSALARSSLPAPRWPRPQPAIPAPRRSPAGDRTAAFPSMPRACAAPDPGPQGVAATRAVQGASRGRTASGYSPPAARGAAASLGSRPGSPNLLFAPEPPERLGVESFCNVAQHPGWRCWGLRLGSPAGSVRSVPRARAPLPLAVGPGERFVELRAPGLSPCGFKKGTFGGART